MLIEWQDGRQEVVEVKNDLGLDKKNVTAIKLALHKQGIDVRQIKRISTAD